MGINSCDHGDYVVVYDMPINKGCPICKMESDHEDEVADLKSQIENLEE